MEPVLMDLHAHSLFSFDGKNTAYEMTTAAARKGIRYFALTEHLDVNLYHDPQYRMQQNIAEADSHIQGLRRQFDGTVKLLYGVELAQPAHLPELTKTLLESYRWDYVIGSCHMVRGFDDFYFLDYKKDNPKKLLTLYFDEMLEMAEQNCFDILGHLTYPLRYIEGEYGITIEMDAFHPVIDKVFQTLIQNGRGMEINTSGLRQKIGRTLPELEYIKRFRTLGGEYLSIGSDAHRTEDVGAGIPAGIALAKAAGFDHITCFIERKPVLIEI